MQLPQIRMTSQMGRIGITQMNGRMEINQPKAEVAMKQPKAVLSISTTKGMLTIDQTQAWEETNLKSPIRLTKEFAQNGRKAGMQGVQRRAKQGAQLIDIHLGGNPIKEQAIQNGYRSYKEPSLTYIPSPLAVKTSYKKGQLHIDVKARKPIIDVQAKKPHMNYKQSDVQISMEQDPSLTIYFEHLYG